MPKSENSYLFQIWLHRKPLKMGVAGHTHFWKSEMNQIKYRWKLYLRSIYTIYRLKGVGGPGVQIMENEFECLADKGDQDRHYAEEFVIKYSS